MGVRIPPGVSTIDTQAARRRTASPRPGVRIPLYRPFRNFTGGVRHLSPSVMRRLPPDRQNLQSPLVCRNVQPGRNPRLGSVRGRTHSQAPVPTERESPRSPTESHAETPETGIGAVQGIEAGAKDPSAAFQDADQTASFAGRGLGTGSA